MNCPSNTESKSLTGIHNFSKSSAIVSFIPALIKLLIINSSNSFFKDFDITNLVANY